MKIRKANIDDIENNLLKIYIEGFRYHYNGRPDVFSNKTDEELKEDLVKRINNNDNILVLDDNNFIKAFTIYKINDKHAKVLWGDQLVVDEKERKKGYGKILIKKIYEIAKQENCVRMEFSCWFFNDNAKKIYEQLGFKKQQIIYEMEVNK